MHFGVLLIMPRPLIPGTRPKIEPLTIDAKTKKTSSSLSKTDRARILNRKRSDQYLKLITQLDAGNHTSLHESIEIIIAAIHAELPELSIEDFPVGIVARCYLGNFFEVHTLNLGGGIIHHYKFFEPLPSELEKARSLSLRPEYAFIEVYSNGDMRAVEEDGNVIFLEGGQDV